MSDQHNSSNVSVPELIRTGRLSPLFQPICSIVEGNIFGYEGLIRGPKNSELYRPDRLFEAARLEGMTFALEVASALSILAAFDQLVPGGRLFLNFSANALVRLARADGQAATLRDMMASGSLRRKLVVEITEHDRVTDFAELLAAATGFRRSGIEFALDDFGDGRSSLRLWAELQPEFVKIDKYFTHGAGDHFQKTQMLRAVANISEALGGQLIAEGGLLASPMVRDICSADPQGSRLKPSRRRHKRSSGWEMLRSFPRLVTRAALPLARNV
jgi:EAL domain-containing protein (putative c-di-GMP-specific phosphodiesterase class I)